MHCKQGGCWCLNREKRPELVTELPTQDTSSEKELHAELDVSGSTDSTIPHPEARARRINGESAGTITLRLASEDVPIPNVKEFGPKLQGYSFSDRCVLGQAEILVVVAESSQVGHARTLPKVEVKPIRIFEGSVVEQRFASIKVAFVLGPGVSSR